MFELYGKMIEKNVIVSYNYSASFSQMRRHKNNMKNRISCWILLAGTIILTGCATQKDFTNTTLEIHKDGTLEHYIAENFEKDYYDQAELQEMIESEISDFNLTEGSEKVQLKEVKMKEGMANPILTYQDASSYAGFNDVTFFFGTIAQAYENEVDLNITLQSVKEDAQIEKEDVLQMGDSYILITEESMNIDTFHAIDYYSNNVTLNGKKEATITTQDGELAYIIFK